MEELLIDRERLHSVRQCLTRHRYDEASICRLLRRETIFGVNLRQRQDASPADDGLDLLTRLFIEGRRVARSAAHHLLGESDTENLQTLGLLHESPEQPNHLIASCALYPVLGVWLASDRWNDPDDPNSKVAKDVVFPGITTHTQGYLRMLPDSPCENLLEVCAGTGVAAIAGAKKFAKHASAVDILDRCRMFAAWNAALNDLSNVRTAQGSLYGPWADGDFDRIVAHPPYVHSVQNTMVYADGGADGETVTRGLIEGIPRALRPGGRFYAHCLVSDREGKPWQERVRDMLGVEQAEFDIAVFQGPRFERATYLQDRVAHGEQTIEQASALERTLIAAGVTHLFQALTVVQRREGERRTFTTRCILSATVESPAVEWYLRLQTALVEPGKREPLLREPLSMAEHVTLQVDYQLRDRRWQTANAQLRLLDPFPTDFEMPEWAAHLLAACDGATTAEMLWKEIQDRPELSALTWQRFLELVVMLLERGFLTTASVGLPPPPPASAFGSPANPEPSQPRPPDSSSDSLPKPA